MYKSVRLFITAYVAAMVTMVALGGTFYVNEKNIIERQARYGEMINMSGRQRMLSQRIVLLTNTLNDRVGEDAISQLAKLNEAIEQMEKSHFLLSRGDLKWRTDNPHVDDLNALYFAGPNALEILVTDHTNTARRKLASGLDEAEPWVTDDKLLNALNQAVTLYEDGDILMTQQLRTFSDFALFASIIVLALLSVFVFRPIMARLKNSEDELREMANTDFLTGCANRRGFMQSTETIMALMKRHQSSLTLIAIDVDHFKRVNDTHGHAVGDEVLKHVAAIVGNCLRDSDILGRTGGEEFAICLPDTKHASGAEVAEKVRSALEDNPYSGMNVTIDVTASFGVCSVRSPIMVKPDLMLDMADQALYEAKERGRNRVCAAPAFIGEPGIEAAAA